MNLYLMQHAPCLPREVKASQPLTPVGQEQTASAARAMRIMGLWFDAILASPFHPAVQTAGIVAEGLGYALSSVTPFEALAAKTSLKASLEALRECERFQSVLLVGELPLLGLIASQLLSSGPTVKLSLDGGAMLALAVPNFMSRSATLRWMLQPAQLQMIAAG